VEIASRIGGIQFGRLEAYCYVSRHVWTDSTLSSVHMPCRPVVGRSAGCAIGRRRKPLSRCSADGQQGEGAYRHGADLIVGLEGNEWPELFPSHARIHGCSCVTALSNITTFLGLHARRASTSHTRRTAGQRYLSALQARVRCFLHLHPRPLC
jgi:hypothetical protein